jgi:PAS domain S-box-containing protein
VDSNQHLFADLVAGRSDSYTLEKRYLKPNGDTVWVRINASRLADQGVDGPWVLGLVEDITEQHQLWEEQRLLAEVFRTGDGVMITDLAGRILRVNPGFETLTGYRADEVLGEPADLRCSEVEGPERAREIEAALAETGHWAGERWSRRKDGSVFPQWETITAVRDEKGEIGRYVVLLHDLTERKLLERERQRRDSATGELGRILAHQLNQPLTAINNFAGGLLNGLRSGPAADENQARGLEQIRTQAQRATEIVSDIRRYLRGEALQTRATDLHALLHSVLPTVENIQDEAPYQLHLDLAASLPPVAGDPVPLQECLLNLVMNAVEAASEEGEPEGEVRISTQVEDNAVELAIADNGAGVPAGLEEQVFQPLFTTKPEGTGLGLSICRSVVQSHGGAIQVEAREPAGAIFRVFLPVAESA